MIERVLRRISRDGITLFRQFAPPGRNITVYEDDVYLVSYPKSGNTWLRFLLANLIYAKSGDVDFRNIDSFIPDIYQNRTGILNSIARPRILKSHEYLDPRYRKMVYILRDPRAVTVSYYHYLIKIKAIPVGYSKSDHVKNFVDGNIDPFGTWQEHVCGWLAARRNDSDFLLLQYENMLEAPVHALKKVVEHLQMDVSDTEIQYAIDKSSFRNMQNLEKQNATQWKAMKGSRQDKMFVRGEDKLPWQDELDIADIRIIESRWGGCMKEVGYELMS